MKLTNRPDSQPLEGIPINASHTAPLTPPSGEGDLEALVQQAQETFDRAQEALQRSDFAAYGAELEQLEEILRRLGELTAEE